MAAGAETPATDEVSVSMGSNETVETAANQTIAEVKETVAVGGNTTEGSKLYKAAYQAMSKQRRRR